MKEFTKDEASFLIKQYKNMKNKEHLTLSYNKGYYFSHYDQYVILDEHITKNITGWLQQYIETKTLTKNKFFFMELVKSHLNDDFLTSDFSLLVNNYRRLFNQILGYRHAPLRVISEDVLKANIERNYKVVTVNHPIKEGNEVQETLEDTLLNCYLIPKETNVTDLNITDKMLGESYLRLCQFNYSFRDFLIDCGLTKPIISLVQLPNTIQKRYLTRLPRTKYQEILTGLKDGLRVASIIDIQFENIYFVNDIALVDL